MATDSVFDDKSREPGEAAIDQVLSGRQELWKALVDLPTTMVDTVTREWSFYSKKSGWVLLLKRKKQTICTVIPKEDEFVVVFLFPERAVQAARETELPEPVVRSIDEAKTYKVGRPFNVSVKSDADLDPVRKLMVVKVESWKSG